MSATDPIDAIVAVLDPLRTGDAPRSGLVSVSAGAYAHMSHEVMRQRHADQLAARPRASATLATAGSHLHLWSREAPNGAPWVGLATATVPEGRPVGVAAAYRIHLSSTEEAADLAAQPTRALATLLVRHGLTHHNGRSRVHISPSHELDLPTPLDRLGPTEFTRAVALSEPPDGAQVTVNFNSATTSAGRTRLTWLFVMNMTSYVAEAAAARR